MARILIIEGDRATGTLVLTLAQGMNHEAELVSDPTEGLERMDDQPFDMVISDVHMKPLNGIELLERIRAQHPKTRVALFSSDHSPELQAQAKQLGAIDFLPKPIRIDRLKSVLDRAKEVVVPAVIERRSAPRPERPAEDFETVVTPFYPGPGLKVVRQRLSWVAQAKSHVLLDARPGVLSREVLEAFHRYSPFAGAPLRIINLETENADDLRDRLTDDPTGWLREMAGGTLVLLALDALPLDVQSILAGLLRTDFRGRIIATIRGDPDTLVGEMKLNDSLYFRLAVFSTRIAPLSEAGEALPSLLADAVAASKAWLGGDTPEVAQQARGPIIAYAWPQNHFELRRVADQIASRLEPGQAIQIDQLPDAVAGAHWPTLAEQLRLTANAYIKRVERTMPDMDQAAQVLGVRRASLERHSADNTRPVFTLDIDNVTSVPWAVAPKPTESKPAIAPPRKVERILLISGNELERANLVGRLMSPDREIVEVGHALAAVSELKIAPTSFNYAIVVPPCAGLTIRELGEQLQRIEPIMTIALIDPTAAPGDCEPYDAVRARPETVLEFDELFTALGKPTKSEA